ncbi:DapH/DapD/GlmU-related protein [Butyricimonas sp. Marseille-P3923]|uniref:acyltransferase n=1 Tax=Butyricimonas sp. Marseille-P3923 TaxID=1987504 RepID=UPI0011460A72|nr:acyltransferase [Butyricimonas sp. Marseille-P3923]
MKKVKSILKKIVYKIPIINDYFRIKKYDHAGFSLGGFIKFKFFTRDKTIYWPMSKNCVVSGARNIQVGKNCSIGNNGCYIQGVGKLIFGDYVRVAMNVGIMSGNHDTLDHSIHIKKVTCIGDYSWIGMNSIILPGVTLGPRTVVAAGSVVTKSFPNGFCVLAGNPAKLVKELDKSQFIPPHDEYDYYGYIPAAKFEKFKNKYLKNNNNVNADLKGYETK